MKLCPSLLDRVPGPLLAAAMAGCAAEVPEARIAPEMLPPPAPMGAVTTTDHAPDTSADEDERLGRLDRARTTADARRDRRIDYQASVQRPPPRPACGRG